MHIRNEEEMVPVMIGRSSPGPSQYSIRCLSVLPQKFAKNKRVPANHSKYKAQFYAHKKPNEWTIEQSFFNALQ